MSVELGALRAALQWAPTSSPTGGSASASEVEADVAAFTAALAQLRARAGDRLAPRLDQLELRLSSAGAGDLVAIQGELQAIAREIFGSAYARLAEGPERRGAAVGGGVPSWTLRLGADGLVAENRSKLLASRGPDLELPPIDLGDVPVERYRALLSGMSQEQISGLVAPVVEATLALEKARSEHERHSREAARLNAASAGTTGGAPLRLVAALSQGELTKQLPELLRTGFANINWFAAFETAVGAAATVVEVLMDLTEAIELQKAKAPTKDRVLAWLQVGLTAGAVLHPAILAGAVTLKAYRMIRKWKVLFGKPQPQPSPAVDRAAAALDAAKQQVADRLRALAAPPAR